MFEETTSSSNQLVGSGMPITTVSSQPKTRLCAGPCGTEIPPARLRAMPSARFCVSCQQELGDVPFIRRYDEAGSDGEVHQTYFTTNSTLEAELHRRNMVAAERSASLTEDDSSDNADKSPSPENTSVRATNLSHAVGEREGELHRSMSAFILEARAVKQTA